MWITEPGGYVESPDGTLVHFIDLELHAEALAAGYGWCSVTVLSASC
jgi:hypothetical protein